MPTAIRIENVSKLYRLGQVGTGTLSHDLNRWWHRIRGKEDPYSEVGQVNRRDQAAQSEYVWALKDINLEVEQGEVLGIIGANGAGKSTLLKLISRISSPTKGFIKARGRIASLLEVGTGMHEEMTARENIYLNGAILGMRRHEITKKFDDIIDFAGCRMYVDTPVKRYSSGMRVRLGFAVAAFLEPEILIVDEVLAVGDAEFQRRAIGKMQDVRAADGRTILFVSHNMAAIEYLCTRLAIIQSGGLALTTSNVVEGVGWYIRETAFSGVAVTSEGTHFIKGVMVSPIEERDSGPIRMGEGLRIRIQLEFAIPAEDPELGIAVENARGARVYWIQSRIQHGSLGRLNGPCWIECDIPDVRLNAGRYYITVACETPGRESDRCERVCAFDVEPANIFGTGRVPCSSKSDAYVPVTWRIVQK